MERRLPSAAPTVTREIGLPGLPDAIEEWIGVHP